MVNLFDTKEVCTHSIPNKVQIVNEKHGFNFGKNQSLYNVNLMQDYKAEAVFCKKEGSCDKTIIHGKWTNIYDQAFDVELENGLRFIANLRYNMKNKLSSDPLAQAQTGGVDSFGAIGSDDYDKFDSICSQTMVGFV